MGWHTALQVVPFFYLSPFVSCILPLAICRPIDLSHTLFAIGMKFLGMMPIYIQFVLDFNILYVIVYFPVLGNGFYDFKLCHISFPDIFLTILVLT